MELKYKSGLMNITRRLSFNRTFMELKCLIGVLVYLMR